MHKQIVVFGRIWTKYHVFCGALLLEPSVFLRAKIRLYHFQTSKITPKCIIFSSISRKMKSSRRVHTPRYLVYLSTPNRLRDMISKKKQLFFSYFPNPRRWSFKAKIFRLRRANSMGFECLRVYERASIIRKSI